MAQIKVSAPGKVILYGEHAVVYGKTAVASSLSLRTNAELTELPESNEKIIQLDFSNINLSISLPIQQILDCFFTASFSHVNCDTKINELLHSVSQFVNTLDPLLQKDTTDYKNQKKSLEAFFFSLVHIGHLEQIDLTKTAFKVHVSSSLELGAGLGSSAAFAVSLAGCLLRWAQLQKNIQKNAFDNDDLEKISNYAKSCEKVTHETPSGIDNTICTYGSIIKFREDKKEKLTCVPDVNLLLVNTKIIRDTKIQVMKAARLKSLYPLIIQPILDSMDIIAEKAWHILNETKSPDLPSTSTGTASNWCEKLSVLVHMNQGLLNALDVSHPKLEMICATAWLNGYAGKLTGAGGGGFAYILLKPHTEMANLGPLIDQLAEQDFNVKMAKIGGDGVKLEY
ncbi:hypothetical protein P5V15_010783 [Pogonomyrmex californicus]